ncbi:MAG: histidine kinase [Chloroflexi bacterium 44-23]|nr:MAG: histidine kinase [Chloroflexi bacterium 44-23]
MTTVRDLMSAKGDEIWSTHPDDEIRTALTLMKDKNIGAVPVVENEQVVGIFSERDFARYSIEVDVDCFNMKTPVKELMIHPVYFVDPGQSIEECMAVMTNKRLRHLPVMNNGILIGIISIGDVIKYLLQEKQKTIDTLEHFLWVNMI